MSAVSYLHRNAGWHIAPILVKLNRLVSIEGRLA